MSALPPSELSPAATSPFSTNPRKEDDYNVILKHVDEVASSKAVPQAIFLRSIVLTEDCFFSVGKEAVCLKHHEYFPLIIDGPIEDLEIHFSQSLDPRSLDRHAQRLTGAGLLSDLKSPPAGLKSVLTVTAAHANSPIFSRSTVLIHSSSEDTHKLSKHVLGQPKKGAPHNTCWNKSYSLSNRFFHQTEKGDWEPCDKPNAFERIERAFKTLVAQLHESSREAPAAAAPPPPKPLAAPAPTKSLSSIPVKWLPKKSGYFIVSTRSLPENYRIRVIQDSRTSITFRSNQFYVFDEKPHYSPLRDLGEYTIELLTRRKKRWGPVDDSFIAMVSRTALDVARRTNENAGTLMATPSMALSISERTSRISTMFDTTDLHGWFTRRENMPPGSPGKIELGAQTFATDIKTYTYKGWEPEKSSEDPNGYLDGLTQKIVERSKRPAEHRSSKRRGRSTGKSK